MYCSECGHPLNEQGICPICGAQNNSQSIPYANANTAAPYQGNTNMNGQYQGTPYGGQQPQSNPYGGQQQANPYGGQQPQSNPYGGQQQANSYGRQQANPYNGQQPQGNPYGRQQAQGNPYGGQQQANPYGRQQPQGNPYGRQQAQGNPYGGQQQANPYGRQQPQGNPYGGQQQANPYGGQQPQGNPYPNHAYPGEMHLQQTATVKTNGKKKWPLITGISVAAAALIITVIAVIVNKNKVRDYTTGTDTEYTSSDFTTDEPTTVSTTESIVNSDEGTKTIMMYIVGSNLESEYGSATDDIGEILNADYDDEKIRILIYTGGSYDWNMNEIPNDKNTTFIVRDGELVELASENKRNMGEPDTLSDFLTYGYENYPSEQYSVILWNHGGGAFSGFGYDEYTNDSLSLPELSEAFENSPFNESNKLEWVGFDACLMANIETADILSPYAKYLVASQESEPGWGWDYGFLEEIDETSDGADIGQNIVDCYISTTENNFSLSPFSYSDITLSVLNLEETDAVETAINNLFSKADESLNDATYTKYSRIRSNTKEIASEFSGEYSYDVVDLMDLAKKMESEFLTEATALESALSNFIVYSRTNEIDANGVSIYYPYNAKQYSGYYIPMYYEFGFASDYADYISNFANLLTGANTLTADWDVETMIPTANGDMSFSLQLTDEQAASCQKAYYVISRADMDQPGNFIFVAMSNQVEMSESNALTANFDGQIIYMQNNTTLEQYEVMYTEQEATQSYTRYLLTSILFNEDISEEDAKYAYFVLETTPDNPQGEILGAYPIENLIVSEGADLFPERYEIDINDYQKIAFGSASHEFTSTEDLTNFNENDWSDVSLWYSEMPISDGFSTTLGGMIPDVPYYGMFIIEDSQGNRHCSNLVQLQ